MLCERCGAELKEDKIYCEKCGNELQIVPDYNPEIEEQIAETLADIVNENFGEEAAETDKNITKINIKPSRAYLLLFAMSVLLLCLGGIIGWQASHKNTYEYQFTKAKEALEKEEYEKALQHYIRASELNPDNLNLRIEIAYVHELLGDTETAVEELTDILKNDPSNLEAYKTMVSIFEAKGEFGKISTLLEQCKNPDIYSYFSAYIVTEPQANLKSGIYEKEIEVSLSSVHGETIYYTLDESSVTEESSKYMRPIRMREGRTVLRAKAFNEKGMDSDEIELIFEITKGLPSAPEILPESGKYTVPVPIQIAVPFDAAAYYTWDGSVPNRGSERYTAPIDMPLGNNIISVVLYDEEGNRSEAVTKNYTLQFESLYEPPEAIVAVKNLLFVRGELLGFDGSAPNITGNYLFTCSTATVVNGQIYFLVNQKHSAGDGKIIPMDFCYAVNADNLLEIYKAYPDGEGNYRMEEV